MVDFEYEPDIPIFNKPDTLIPNVYDPQTLNRYAFERSNPYKYTDPTGHQPVSQADDNAVDNFPQRIASMFIYRHLEKSGALPPKPRQVGVFYDTKGEPYLDYVDKHNIQKEKSSGDKSKQPTYGTYVPPEAIEERERLGKEICERTNIDCGEDSRIKPKLDPELLENYISKKSEEKDNKPTSSSGGGSSGGGSNVICETTCSCNIHGSCSCKTHCTLQE